MTLDPGRVQAIFLAALEQETPPPARPSSTANARPTTSCGAGSRRS